MASEVLCLFFFSSRGRHTGCSRDWSSDVCSSDLRSNQWRQPTLDPTGIFVVRRRGERDGIEILREVVRWIDDEQIDESLRQVWHNLEKILADGSVDEGG